MATLQLEDFRKILDKYYRLLIFEEFLKNLKKISCSSLLMKKFLLTLLVPLWIIKHDTDKFGNLLEKFGEEFGKYLVAFLEKKKSKGTLDKLSKILQLFLKNFENLEGNWGRI